MPDSRSWTILDGLRDNLESYLISNRLNSEKFVVETLDKPDIDLLAYADNKRITDFHVGIYEISPNELTKVSASKAIDYNQGYEIKIFKALTKDGQYDVNAERRMMNVKDLIKDWADQLEPYSITGNYLYTLIFDGTNTPIRDNRYISLTQRFAGFRTDI